MEIKHKKVILSGRACSGKDSVYDVIKEYGYKRIAFADPIKDIRKEYFGVNQRNRLIEQQIGQKFREINPDVWVNYAFEKSKEYEMTCVTDARQENEIYKALEYDFLPIRIISFEDIRIQRAIKRDGDYPDISLWENESETKADHIPMITICNNGTLKQLKYNIENIIQGKFQGYYYGIYYKGLENILCVR